jgi:ABC-2 type transport system permease protein
LKTLVLPVYSLWRREIVRFVRQRSRVFGSLLQPLGFWLVLGAGFGRSFRPPGAEGSLGDAASYLAYAFPGTLIMIVLFTAIFSTISVIEDRREGFLQGVLVAPVPRSVVVLGKVLGGTTLAVLQALLFLALAPLVGFSIPAASVIGIVGLLAVAGFALTSLGFVIAWRMDSIAGFHAIMNMLLLPMWLLSGAVFPASGAATVMRWVMAANPLSYTVSALRHFFGEVRPAAGASHPHLGVAIAINVAFALVVFAVATLAARSRAVVDPT